VLGGLLALLSAGMFAFESATARRGVVTASVVQALAITVPVGVPIFLLCAAAFGALPMIAGFPAEAIAYLAAAGVLHFVWGRYCNYRAAKAMGANLVAPVQQSNMLVTLALAVWILGEHLTALRVLGIGLVILGPMLTYDRKRGRASAPTPAVGIGERSDAVLRTAMGEPTGPAQLGRPDDRLRDAVLAATPAEPAPPRKLFQPNYAEGYLFALLSSTGYGISPVLIRLALEDKALQAGIAGGLISYSAAALAFALLLMWPGQWREARALDRGAAKWFAISGVCVCFAQMLRYLALVLAPVSVVTPIQRLSLVFRLYFSRIINPEHEQFGGRIVAATVVSLIGALALSVSTELVQSMLPLPEWAKAVLNWRWP
jgi:drug/metabolite transporter (DMT)-like permease